ncbi:hypothetical protein EUX98_g4582 [Antrodiella citrinella]|uniref:NADAR domain-containing protein n=1 Tax=Antrodiella citrinella TaxID=2447956 RepID=A0A4S4MUI8_9APHY|nr:hypothetical protein EUX98_g4582 [Antrodiella citrinella]
MNMNGPQAQGDQHWQAGHSGVRARDMFGQPLLDERGAHPQQDSFGGMNDGFESQGPQHPLAQRGGLGLERAPHKKRRRPPPPGLDNFNLDDPSFNPDGPPSSFPPGQQDFPDESMLQPPRGRMRREGNMNMHPGGDMDMQMDGGVDMDQFQGPPSGHHPNSNFDGPSFGEQQAFAPGRNRQHDIHDSDVHMEGFTPGRTHQSDMNDSGPRMGGARGFPPPADFGGQQEYGGQGGGVGFSGDYDESPMHRPEHEMGFEPRTPSNMRDSQDRFLQDNQTPRRRQRRFSDSNLTSFQEPGFQNGIGSRDHFHTMRPGRSAGLSHSPYIGDDDSARYYGSDPTDRHRRPFYDDNALRSPVSRHSRSTNKRILFYDQRKPYFGFNNRSPYAVVYRGKKYPTAEHLYHAFKFEHHRPDISEKIRKFPSANAAISEAHRYDSERRSDWRDVKLRKMEEVVSLKFDQHRDLRIAYLSVQASYNDSFWGVGSDGVGRNEFGKLLARHRDELRRGGSSKRRTSSPHYPSTRDLDTSVRGRTSSRRPIRFFAKSQPHYGFSNYASYPVVYNGKRYPTSQHLFQAFKFLGHNPELAEHIRLFSTYPDIITAEAHRRERDVRSDWRDISIAKMEEVLWHKFNQHPDLKRELLDTKDAELIFDAREDIRWGIGSDGRGRNDLGKALERVRSRLRSDSRFGDQQTIYNIPFERELIGQEYASRSFGSAKLRRHTRGPSLPNIMTGLFGGRRSPKEQITFDHRTEPYYGFSNLAPFPVNYLGMTYPTAEHLFQSFKFEKKRPDLVKHIRTCSSNPQTAIAEARRHAKDVRGDWKSVNGRKMEEVLWLKFTQHGSLADALVSTGDAELVEENDRDSYWGIGPDGQGRNEFGKVLEKIRSRLRH